MLLKVKHKDLPTKEQLVKQFKRAIYFLEEAAKLPTVAGKVFMFKLSVIFSHDDTDTNFFKLHTDFILDDGAINSEILDEWCNAKATTVLDNLVDYKEDRDSEGGFYLLYELSLVSEYLNTISVEELDDIDELDRAVVPKLEVLETSRLTSLNLYPLVENSGPKGYNDDDVMDVLLLLMQDKFVSSQYNPSWLIKDKVITLTNVDKPYAIKDNRNTFDDIINYFKAKPNTQWFISYDFSEAIEDHYINIDKIKVEVKVGNTVDKWEVKALDMFTYVTGLCDSNIPSILTRFLTSLEKLTSELLWLFINNSHNGVSSIYEYKDAEEITRMVDYLNVIRTSKRNGGLKLIKGGIE